MSEQVHTCVTVFACVYVDFINVFRIENLLVWFRNIQTFQIMANKINSVLVNKRAQSISN
jgi:hypothetical protein